MKPNTLETLLPWADIQGDKWLREASFEVASGLMTARSKDINGTVDNWIIVQVNAGCIFKRSCH